MRTDCTNIFILGYVSFIVDTKQLNTVRKSIYNFSIDTPYNLQYSVTHGTRKILWIFVNFAVHFRWTAIGDLIKFVFHMTGAGSRVKFFFHIVEHYPRFRAELNVTRLDWAYSEICSEDEMMTFVRLIREGICLAIHFLLIFQYDVCWNIS